MLFRSVIDACFARLGADAVYVPVGGAAIMVRVMAKRPDDIIGLGDTRVHTETAIFDVRASEVASPRPGDRIEFDGATYVVQGEPERRDLDRLIWTLDTRKGG